MKPVLVLVCAVAASMLLVSTTAPAEEAPATANRPTAEELVRAVEQLMYPDAKATATLHFVSSKGESEDYAMVYYARDVNQRIIVRMTAPASAVGNDILMVDQNVWAYDKAAARVMKVASNQSFGGTGFSYGDVVRLNFSGNYDAVIKSETETDYLLELTAKNRSAPYYRIELTVDRRGRWPVKGIHYARNGSIVKETTYSQVKNVGAGEKPVVLTVSSPVDPGAVNVLTIKRELRKDLPERLFNKRNLETRLEEGL